jgi:putative glutamine amidotransferase
VAQPDQWLVEAYESRQHRWVIGVQWHPERVFELDPGHRRLWESFVAVCRQRA